jgi:probable addiction module antidote protein
MIVKSGKLDIAVRLETDEDIREFLREIAQTGDTSDLIRALNIAARAKGMTEIAKQIGVTRASLYKSLSEDGIRNAKSLPRLLKH